MRPPPKLASTSFMPILSLPSFFITDSSEGMDALDVLPVSCNVIGNFEISMPSFFGYMIKFSLVVLLPVYIIVQLIFI